MSQGH
jgi:NIMA (never in mitosis gene a)-related kinase